MTWIDFVVLLAKKAMWKDPSTYAPLIHVDVLVLDQPVR